MHAGRRVDSRSRILTVLRRGGMSVVVGLGVVAPAVAVFARANLINTVADRPYAEVPEWFTKWESTGLIQFDDLNDDGLIQ